MIVSDFQKIAAAVTAGESKKTQTSGEAGSDAFAALLGILMSQGMNTQGISFGAFESGDGSQINSNISSLMDTLVGQQNIKSLRWLINSNTGIETEISLSGAGDGSQINSNMSAIMEALSGQENIAGNTEGRFNNVLFDAIMNSGMVENALDDLKTGVSGEKTPEQPQGQTIGLNVETQPKVEQANMKNQSVTSVTPWANGDSIVAKISQSQEDTKNEIKATVQYEAKDEIEQYVLPRPNIIKILKESESSKGQQNPKDGQKGIDKAEIPVNGADKAKASGAAEKERSSKGETDEKSTPSLNKQENTFNTMLEDRVAFQSKNEVVHESVKQGTAINKEDVLNQVIDRIKVINLKDASEISFSLKPEELGHVAIKLVMEKGMMTGRIMVENSQIKSLIETNLPQVKEQLKSQNINVSELNVSVGLGQGNSGGNQRNAESRWTFNREAYSREQSVNVVSEIATQRAVSHSGSLNLLA